MARRFITSSRALLECGSSEHEPEANHQCQEAPQVLDVELTGPKKQVVPGLAASQSLPMVLWLFQDAAGVVNCLVIDAKQWSPRVRGDWQPRPSCWSL